MRVPCVGVVVLDQEGRLLVVRRAHPPSQGRWSIPGGRVEPGESLEAAAAREAWEETGLTVRVGAALGRVELPDIAGDVYDVTDFTAAVVGDDLARPGDDADDARWVTRAELDALPASPGLVETLDSWGVWA
jgi:8-oxo-dGTP diphosphatase